MAFIHFVKFKLGDFTCFSKPKAYFSKIRYIKSQKCIQSFLRAAISLRITSVRTTSKLFHVVPGCLSHSLAGVFKTSWDLGKIPTRWGQKIEFWGCMLPPGSCPLPQVVAIRPPLSPGVWRSPFKWLLGGQRAGVLKQMQETGFSCVSPELFVGMEDWPKGSLAVGKCGMWHSLSPAHAPVLFERDTPMLWEREFTTFCSAVFTPALSSTLGVPLGC